MIVALGFGDLLCRTDHAAVEIHHTAIRRGVGKDYTAAAPVAGRVRPSAGPA
jgi:hypothetical protein